MTSQTLLKCNITKLNSRLLLFQLLVHLFKLNLKTVILKDNSHLETKQEVNKNLQTHFAAHITQLGCTRRCSYNTLTFQKSCLNA